MSNSATEFAQPISTWEMGLGIAYVVAGVGLFAAVLTNSLDLIVAALAATLLLIVLSLGTVLYREGLATPENGVIGVCVLAAMGLLFGLDAYTSLPSEAVFAVVLLVGVIVPHLLVHRLGYGAR
jgi:hypothetical protein